MKRRLLEFLDRSRVLDQSQHGFRSGKSTMTALVALMENIVKAVDEGRLVQVLTCDLSKAFDSVERDILLQKMEIYGVRGKALAIFESYLKNRTQVVSWNNEVSKVNILKYGVPQGSILGPLLFLIYVNDLPNNVSCSLTSMYADDASFVNDSFRRTDLEIKGAETLASAEKWFSTNGLKLNVDKSCRMIVAGSERPQSVKVLGMTLDNRLTWNTYTTPLLKRLSTAIFTIRRMREVAGSDISVLTYYANFHQTATYGIILWGHSPGLMSVLLKQKEAVRAIFGVPRTISCRELFRSLGILTVTSVYILTCILHVYDNRSKFRQNNDHHHYTTRHRNELSIEFHRLKKTQTGTNHFGVKFYNRLPSKLQILPRHLFRKRIKGALVENAVYSFAEFWDIKFE